MMTQTWSRCGTPVGTLPSCASAVPAKAATSIARPVAFLIIKVHLSIWCTEKSGFRRDVPMPTRSAKAMRGSLREGYGTIDVLQMNGLFMARNGQNSFENLRLWASSRNDLIRPHHFVVLMFEKVAVPDIAARIAFELGDNASDHSRMGLDCIFPSRLVGCWRNRHSDIFYGSVPVVVLRFKRAPVQHLKANTVEVDWVRIIGKIHQPPDLHRIQSRTFGHRHVPMGVVEQHHHGVAGAVIFFSQRQHSRFC